MPSAAHQTLVALLLERPELLTIALAPGAGPSLPGGARIRAASAAFTDLTPPSYHADMVLRVEDDRGRLRHLFIGEVQLRRDRRKHISWPIYVTAARAEVGLDCPVTLVVVALTPAVARWCAQPIALDARAPRAGRALGRGARTQRGGARDSGGSAHRVPHSRQPAWPFVR